MHASCTGVHYGSPCCGMPCWCDMRDRKAEHTRGALLLDTTVRASTGMLVQKSEPFWHEGYGQDTKGYPRRLGPIITRMNICIFLSIADHRRLPLRFDAPVLAAGAGAGAAVTADPDGVLAACCGWPPPTRNERGESFISSCIFAISSGSTFMFGATRMMNSPNTADTALLLHEL